MIQISKSISIDETKIKFQAIRASGPGGQHVNKVSTAIQLKFAIKIEEYPDWFIDQLKKNANSLITKDGVIVIKSMGSRSQKQNKDNAMNRLIKLFKKSAIRPKQRIATKPTKTSREKRIQAKKAISSKKKLRKPPSIDD